MKTAIGERIRNARKAKSMTQAALGEKSRLATSTICDIEKGRSKPSLDSLERISAALGVAPSFFMSDDYVNNIKDAHPRLTGTEGTAR